MSDTLAQSEVARSTAFAFNWPWRMVLAGAPFSVVLRESPSGRPDRTGLERSKMSTYALAREGDPQAPGGPGAVVLWALALLGLAAGLSSVAFAVTNNAIGAELGEPLVIAVLWSWTTLAYVLCGMFAWWRRPASRIGPLMIATGFVCYIVTLSWTTSDIPYTTSFRGSASCSCSSRSRMVA
jgi:hypothetical protein